MLLNFLGGIVGGVWLAVLGKWGLLGIGILSIFISSSSIVWTMMPSLLLTVPGALAIERGKWAIGMPCLLIANLWISAVMAVWCVGCFWIVKSYHTNGTIWPYLLWAYSMATGPWTYMASKSAPDEYGSTISAFAACLGAIAIMGVLLFEDSPTLIDASVAFCIPISFALIIQIVLAIMLGKERTQQRYS